MVNKILSNPALWDLSQAIFGCDKQKRALYRSVFPKTGKILDFGCADGNTFPAFSDFEYVGVDINKDLIQRAVKKYGAYKNASFVAADILERPFGEGEFDYALFSCTGHHLPDETLYPVMKELSRVLKKNGSLHFFDTIKRPGIDPPFLRFLINLDQGKFMRNEEIYKKMIHGFSADLVPTVTKVLRIKGALMPQPTYFYAEFRKK